MDTCEGPNQRQCQFCHKWYHKKGHGPHEATFCPERPSAQSRGAGNAAKKKKAKAPKARTKPAEAGYGATAEQNKTREAERKAREAEGLGFICDYCGLGGFGCRKALGGHEGHCKRRKATAVSGRARAPGRRGEGRSSGRRAEGCYNCGVTSSSCWRKGLCNACGLYHQKHGRHRATQMKGAAAAAVVAAPPPLPPSPPERRRRSSPAASSPPRIDGAIASIGRAPAMLSPGLAQLASASSSPRCQATLVLAVERIVAKRHRVDPITGPTTEYLTRWLGDAQPDSWETADTFLNNPTPLETFESARRRKRGRERSPNVSPVSPPSPREIRNANRLIGTGAASARRRRIGRGGGRRASAADRAAAEAEAEETTALPLLLQQEPAQLYPGYGLGAGGLDGGGLLGVPMAAGMGAMAMAPLLGTSSFLPYAPQQPPVLLLQPTQLADPHPGFSRFALGYMLGINPTFFDDPDGTLRTRPGMMHNSNNTGAGF